jgi:hypothetical protein
MATLAATGPRGDGHGASLGFVGSTAGRFGEAGHAEYATAKAGLVGLMRSLKNEIVTLDPFARVNAVEPGWTVTHMVRPTLDQPGVIARALATMPVRQPAAPRIGRCDRVASRLPRRPAQRRNARRRWRAGSPGRPQATLAVGAGRRGLSVLFPLKRTLMEPAVALLLGGLGWWGPTALGDRPRRPRAGRLAAGAAGWLV